MFILTFEKIHIFLVANRNFNMTFLFAFKGGNYDDAMDDTGKLPNLC